MESAETELTKTEFTNTELAEAESTRERRS